ncbi:stage V sporulation protein AC [Paenibacillus sp.]|jgi:stage V sporulation protein AC|uniref:stage V sporulation protein AC n=1 Tax=Paenibacillus sp. TaxID=58172 RepID=UPI002822259C|nr:stage V sporulation protein AC [Paenibacillus sp.]MDR0267931.1 stage V sporulation protein AC [Paenibacillus sp.]
MPAGAKNKGGIFSLDTLTNKEYKDIAQKHEPPRTLFKNCIWAFLIGGGICLFGQVIQQGFVSLFDMTVKQAASPTVAVLVIISVILTSTGVYDNIAQIAGAGTAVPVTGFANSMCSAALEHKAEGYVLGVGANMFKLAGSVIVFGTVAAFFVGLVYAIFGIEGVHHL